MAAVVTAGCKPAPSVDRWIDLYRSEGKSPLPQWVEANLHAERRAGGLRLIVAWVLPALTVAASLAALVAVALLGNSTGGAMEIAVVASIIAMVLAMGMTFLLGRDGVRMRRRARRDLKHGMVERFVLDPRARDALMEAAGGESRLAPPEVLEVLPISSRLIARDGEPLRKPEAVKVAKLATSPEDAQLEPIALDAYAESRATGTDFVARLRGRAAAQRALNDAERSELRAFRRRLFRAWMWLPLPAVFIVLGALSFHGGRMSGGGWLFWAFWIAMGVYAMRAVWVNQRLSKRIGRDLLGGCVYVLDDETMRALAQDQSPDTELPERMPSYGEFLPWSGLQWTVEGVPAPWRAAAQDGQR